MRSLPAHSTKFSSPRRSAMANVPPKRGVISRLKSILKKKGGTDQRIHMSDFSEERCPEEVLEKVEMDVLIKWTGKAKPRHRNKKQRVILDNGQLELRERNNPETTGLACGYYSIDFSKVTVCCKDRRIWMTASTDHILSITMIDRASASRLKEAVNQHRLYRQETVQREQPKSTPTTTDSLVSTNSDFKMWHWDPNTSKVLESVRDMQLLSLAVLEKSTECLDKLKRVAEELRVLCDEKPAEKTSSKEKIVKIVTNKTSQKEDEDVEMVDADLDDETERELLARMAPTATRLLLSLESSRQDQFDQQRKQEVMTRCEKILSKS